MTNPFIAAYDRWHAAMVDHLVVRPTGHVDRVCDADDALTDVWDSYSRRLRPITTLGRTGTRGSCCARERFLDAVYRQTAWPE
jgi:hypothetical protein